MMSVAWEIIKKLSKNSCFGHFQSVFFTSIRQIKKLKTAGHAIVQMGKLWKLAKVLKICIHSCGQIAKIIWALLIYRCHPSDQCCRSSFKIYNTTRKVQLFFEVGPQMIFFSGSLILKVSFGNNNHYLYPGPDLDLGLYCIISLLGGSI